MNNTIYNDDFYKNLKKSKLNPPNYVFGIVWTFLYILLIISFILIWKDKKCFPFCRPLFLFIVQIILNLAWTTIFFRFKKIKLALVITIIILLLTIYIFFDFYKINKYAAYLLIPYILWLCFAIYLNLYIIMNN